MRDDNSGELIHYPVNEIKNKPLKVINNNNNHNDNKKFLYIALPNKFASHKKPKPKHNSKKGDLLSKLV